MTTIIPPCQKCDSQMEVTNAEVTVAEDCFLLVLSVSCVECGAEWHFDWTVEALVKWAYDNEKPQKASQSSGVLIAEHKGLSH